MNFFNSKNKHQKFIDAFEQDLKEHDAHVYDENYELSYWFQYVKKRSELTPIPLAITSNTSKNEHLIADIDGHYTEYKNRLSTQDENFKSGFISCRVNCYKDIYYRIKNHDYTSFSTKEKSDFLGLLYHAKASYYGALKFYYLDLGKGPEQLRELDLNYEAELLNAKNTLRQKEEVQARQFIENKLNKEIRNYYNFHLLQKLHTFITQKDTPLFASAENMINNYCFPVDTQMPVTLKLQLSTDEREFIGNILYALEQTIKSNFDGSRSNQEYVNHLNVKQEYDQFIEFINSIRP